jgi:hypothetical protein
MCDSANIGTVSQKVFWKNQDWPTFWMKPGFWKFKTTTDEGSARNQCIYSLFNKPDQPT